MREKKPDNLSFLVQADAVKKYSREIYMTVLPSETTTKS